MNLNCHTIQVIEYQMTLGSSGTQSPGWGPHNVSRAWGAYPPEALDPLPTRMARRELHALKFSLAMWNLSDLDICFCHGRPDVSLTCEFAVDTEP